MDTEQIRRTLENLLPRVQEKLDKSREIAKLRNENFNVFSVLRKEHDEEHLHSAFISELLNPKGSHDHGKVFLKAFLELLEGYNEFSSNDKVVVYTEKTFEEGRLDILLIDEQNNILIIENKIWAGDQHGQLARYHNYIKNHGGNGHIFYLTLHGTDASESSLNHANTKVTKEEYSLISYHTNIVKWLERCFQLAADHPPLRETIKQYLNIVKKLTGQQTNTEMEKEIEKLVLNHPEAAWYIHQNLAEWHKNKVIQFIKEIGKRVTHELLDNDWDHDLNHILGKQYPSLLFRNKRWDKNLYLNLQGKLRFEDGYTTFGLVIHDGKIPPKKLVDIINSAIDIIGEDYDKPMKNWWLIEKKLFDLRDPIERDEFYNNYEGFIKKIVVEITKKACDLDALLVTNGFTRDNNLIDKSST